MISKKKVAIEIRIYFFSERQVFHTVVEFSNGLLCIVDDCQVLGEMYRHTLINTFVIGINEFNFRTELLTKMKKNNVC